jgi:hypothetical protein
MLKRLLYEWFVVQMNIRHLSTKHLNTLRLESHKEAITTGYAAQDVSFKLDHENWAWRHEQKENSSLFNVGRTEKNNQSQNSNQVSLQL